MKKVHPPRPWLKLETYPSRIKTIFGFNHPPKQAIFGSSVVPIPLLSIPVDFDSRSLNRFSILILSDPFNNRFFCGIDSGIGTEESEPKNRNWNREYAVQEYSFTKLFNERKEKTITFRSPKES